MRESDKLVKLLDSACLLAIYFITSAEGTQCRYRFAPVECGLASFAICAPHGHVPRSLSLVLASCFPVMALPRSTTSEF